MTNKESLLATVGFDVPDNMAIKALIDASLQPDEQYTGSKRNAIDNCAIQVLISMKSVNSMSEGGFSVSFNHEEANKTITYLSTRLSGGDAAAVASIGGKPKITTVKRW